MPSIPDGFAQVNFMLRGSSVPSGAEMTLGIRLDDDLSPSDVGSIFEDAFAANNPWASMVDECELYQMLIKFGPSDVGPSAIYALVLTGEDNNPGLQPNTSMLIQKITSAGGRAGRGRFYMPGFSEPACDQSGNWTTFILNEISTAWNGVLSDVSSAFATPVVLHGENSPLELPSTITSFVCSPVAATQRRRMRR